MFLRLVRKNFTYNYFGFVKTFVHCTGCNTKFECEKKKSCNQHCYYDDFNNINTNGTTHGFISPTDFDTLIKKFHSNSLELTKYTLIESLDKSNNNLNSNTSSSVDDSHDLYDLYDSHSSFDD